MAKKPKNVLNPDNDDIMDLNSQDDAGKTTPNESRKGDFNFKPDQGKPSPVGRSGLGSKSTINQSQEELLNGWLGHQSNPNDFKGNAY